jgi:hypothetical protein
VAEAAAAAVLWLTEGEVVLTALEAFAIATSVELVAASAYNNYAKRRARDKMRDAHNASLRDRYVMARSGISQRRIVLGRQRVSGSVSFIKSYGANKEKLVTIVPLSAEEIDAVEAIYFDDEQVVLDGGGNVIGINRRELFTISSAGATFSLQEVPKTGTVSAMVRYGSTETALTVTGVVGKDVTVSGASASLTGQVTVSYQPAYSPHAPTEGLTGTSSITTNGSGAGSVTLPNPPTPGTVWVLRPGNATIDSTDTDVTPLSSVAGSVVSLTGAAPSTTYTVTYQYTSPAKARIRVYRGEPGQVADAALIAALPGVWTSAHVGNGIAYLVMEADYDPDAFSSGVPNLSALVRGSKVFDPRTGVTAWTENPALLARHVATHPLGGRLTASRINDETIIAAANVCDTMVSYVVGGRTYTRKRYTAGLVLSSGQRADDVIQDLCEAMGGDRAFTDGQLRVKAGAWVTPVQVLDESWLIREAGSVQSQRRRPMEEVANVISGVFADEESDYQVRDFPTVRSATYIAEDGQELPEDIDLNAVTFSAQAQQIAAQRMRRKRFGRRISVTCNMRAYGVEWGDVLYVNLPTRFGFVNLPCEVLDVSFTVDGGIALAMEEIGPEIWAIGDSFSEVVLRPNVFSPSPVLLPPVTGLSVSTADAVQVRNADGTVVQRMRVSWDTPAEQSVAASGGGVEVRYGVASWPEAQWLRVFAEGGASRVDIPGVQQGQLYLVKARYYNSLVNGRWSLPVLHAVGARSIVVDTPQLAAGAATQVEKVQVASLTVNASSGTGSTYPAPPSSSARWAYVGTMTFTAQATSGNALLHISAKASYTGVNTIDVGRFIAAAEINFDWDNDQTEAVGDNVAELYDKVPNDTGVSVTAKFQIATTRSVSVTSGVTYTWPIYARKLEGTLTLTDFEARLEIIKR